MWNSWKAKPQQWQWRQRLQQKKKQYKKNILTTGYSKLNKRVIIAGGGTGGHIFPAIAIANALKKLSPSVEILFVGAKGKMEMEKVPQAGYKIVGLDIAGFNRSSLIKNIGLPFKLIKSAFQAGKLIKEFKPHIVIGVGGYASFPMLRAAQRRNIPTLIQEQNSFAGKTNQLMGKRAARICVGYDGMEKFFPKEKIIITGNPVRAVISQSKIDRTEALAFFGLKSEPTTVLVVGGSLGAKAINEAIDQHIEMFAKNNLQLIWQTGKPYSDKAKQTAKGRANVWSGDFIMQMEYAYAAGDIVISRAGALAIAELCVAGKPVLFVPFPFASEDHQTVNAMSLVNKGAGLIVKDSEAAEKAVPMIVELASNNAQRQLLSEQISTLAIRDADERIAREVLNIMEQ
jgi:UDP-N-acetylglucosamine--N-acetylmuramyl-(pentapeptide) pyrophosphoryl-undecaprenol N-acetylglucosamine transferase